MESSSFIQTTAKEDLHLKRSYGSKKKVNSVKICYFQTFCQKQGGGDKFLDYQVIQSDKQIL